MEFEEIIRFEQSLDYSKESVDKLYLCLLDDFNLQKPEDIINAERVLRRIDENE